ncbi:MAG: hypothetical protein KAY37_13440 [Phycisphaerae bacterium]|nr:hypothetical protein [Phycisphaerae bacterium]
MGKITLTSVHKERIALVMFALAALLLLDGIYQVGMHVRWRSWIPTTLAAEPPTTQPAQTQPAETQPADTQPAETQSADTQPVDTQPADTQSADTQPADSQPADSQPAAAPPSVAPPPTAEAPPSVEASPTAEAPPPPPKPVEVSAALKRRNIMAPPPPKRHRMKLAGVLGNVALFTTKKGKTVAIEEGKSQRGLKVISIDGYDVKIEFGGKTETLQLFPAGPGSAQAAPPTSPKVTPPESPPSGHAPPQTQPARITGNEIPSSQPKE